MPMVEYKLDNSNLYIYMPYNSYLENIAIIKNDVEKIIYNSNFKACYLDLSQLQNFDLTLVQLIFSLYLTLSKLGKELFLIHSYDCSKIDEKLVIFGFNKISDPNFFNLLFEPNL